MFPTAHPRKASAALLHAMAGAVWPRARKYGAGFVPSPLCPRCHTQPETLRHRIWQCSANIDDKDSNLIFARTAHLVDEAVTTSDTTEIFWLRGLPPLAWYSVDSPLDECEMLVMGDTELPDGEYFSDSSGAHYTADARLRPCGSSFAHVIFDRYQRVHRTARGTFGALPGPRQTVPRAELYGVVQLALALQSSNTSGNVVLWVDCDYVRRVAARGWFKPGDANADLWQLFFQIRGALRCSLALRRIWRSHSKAEDIERGFIPRCHVNTFPLVTSVRRNGP